MMNGSAIRTGACLPRNANPRGSRIDLCKTIRAQQVEGTTVKSVGDETETPQHTGKQEHYND